MRDIQRAPEPPHQQEGAKTVLPSPLASAVSFVTATSSVSLRIGGFFGRAAINGARVGTLTGFELGRTLLEGILSRAGHDLVTTSSGQYGKAAAESILERAVSI